jgi:hypothetical protein
VRTRTAPVKTFMIDLSTARLPAGQFLVTHTYPQDMKTNLGTC